MRSEKLRGLFKGKDTTFLDPLLEDWCNIREVALRHLNPEEMKSLQSLKGEDCLRQQNRLIAKLLLSQEETQNLHYGHQQCIDILSEGLLKATSIVKARPDCSIDKYDFMDTVVLLQDKSIDINLDQFMSAFDALMEIAVTNASIANSQDHQHTFSF
jgi:hypothetical protein